LIPHVHFSLPPSNNHQQQQQHSIFRLTTSAVSQPQASALCPPAAASPHTFDLLQCQAALRDPRTSTSSSSTTPSTPRPHLC
jgi:hypothetical protein